MNTHLSTGRGQEVRKGRATERVQNQGPIFIDKIIDFSKTRRV